MLDVIVLNVVARDVVQASKTDLKLGQTFDLIEPIEQNILDTYAGN
jgi:hypothetical protein